MYSYVFRVGRVVAKVFVAEGAESDRKLEPQIVKHLCQRAVNRINAAEQVAKN